MFGTGAKEEGKVPRAGDTRVSELKPPPSSVTRKKGEIVTKRAGDLRCGDLVEALGRVVYTERRSSPRHVSVMFLSGQEKNFLVDTDLLMRDEKC
jgi:hypothetical protein